MLDFKEAKQVQQYIKDNLFPSSEFPDDLISVNTLSCIPPVCKLDHLNDHTIFAIQHYNETILVWVERNKDGLKIHNAQKVKW